MRAVRRRACMHEALFDDASLDGTGVTTLDFAKALIDEGFHPMTIYFPLVVHGAMLIEPTEIRRAKPRSTCSSRRCAISRGREARRHRALLGRALSRAAPPARRDARRAPAGAALDAAGAAERSRGVIHVARVVPEPVALLRHVADARPGEVVGAKIGMRFAASMLSILTRDCADCFGSVSYMNSVSGFSSSSTGWCVRSPM